MNELDEKKEIWYAVLFWVSITLLTFHSIGVAICIYFISISIGVPLYDRIKKIEKRLEEIAPDHGREYK